MTIERMTEYTIDLEKWRCGGDSENQGCRIGDGETKLLNSQGFMCCLGQFAEQRGYAEFLLDNGEPSDVASDCGAEYDNNFVVVDVDDDGIVVDNTALAGFCIEINDDDESDIWEKLCALAKHMDREGLTLNVTGDLPI